MRLFMLFVACLLFPLVSADLIITEDFEDSEFLDTFWTSYPYSFCGSTQLGSGYDSIAITDHEASNGMRSLRYDACESSVDPISGLPGCNDVRLVFGYLEDSAVNGTMHELQSYVQESDELFVRYRARYDSDADPFDSYGKELLLMIDQPPGDYAHNQYLAQQGLFGLPMDAAYHYTGGGPFSWEFRYMNNDAPGVFVRDGQWHMFEFYNQYSTGTTRAWIDGELVLEWSGMAITNHPRTLRLHFFNYDTDGFCTSRGIQIDDFEVWSSIPNIPTCSHNQITAPCDCAGSTRTYGYCFEGSIWHPEQMPECVPSGEPTDVCVNGFFVDCSQVGACPGDEPLCEFATINVAAGNNYVLFMNGHHVGFGDTPLSVDQHLVPLRAGQNVVALNAFDTELRESYAAIEIDACGQIVISDTSWKVTMDKPLGWNNLGIDDSSWSNAALSDRTPPSGLLHDPQPIMTVYQPDQGDYHVGWFRKSFEVEELILYYRDADGDGFGNATNTILASTQPIGYVLDNTDCDDSNNQAYPGAPELCDGVDNNCNGVVDQFNEPCGNGVCQGTRTCTLGSWSICSTSGSSAGVCASCNHEGTIIFDSSQNSACQGNDISEVSTCFFIPDGNDFTFDFYEGFTSSCVSIGVCSQNSQWQSELTHTCNTDVCPAQCESDSHCANTCENNVYYFSGTCTSGCECQYSSTDCDSFSGWYASGNMRWLSQSECTEYQEIEEEYRQYACGLPDGCSYTEENTRWVETGVVRNKQDGTACDDASWCTILDQCTDGECVGTPRDCADEYSCTTDTCDEVAEQCVNDQSSCGVCQEGFIPLVGCLCGGILFNTGYCCEGAHSGVPCPSLSECTDADGDGWVVESGGCSLVGGQIGFGDCNDTNPFVNPGAPEICGNGIDDNCSGQDEECPLCGNGLITLRCSCGGTIYDGVFGYCCANTFSERTCPEGLDNVLWLEFENDLADSSVYAHQGVCLGATCPSFVLGAVERAARFDGVDDSVQIVHSSAFDLDHLTLSAWVYVSEFSGNNRIISKEYGTSQPYSLFSLMIGGVNNRNVDFRIGVNGVRHILLSSEELIPGQWTHLAATYDGVVMRLFINGVPDQNTLSVEGVLQKSNRPVYIGASQFYPRFFSGRIDDARVYSRALSQQEIQELVDEGSVCTLEQTAWNGVPEQQLVTEGVLVSLVTTGTGCDGFTLSHEVWRLGVDGTPYPEHTSPPSNAVFSEGVASTTWSAHWYDDGDQTQFTDYIYTARIVEDEEIAISINYDSRLIVERLPCPEGDLNDDCVVDIEDFHIVSSYYHQEYQADLDGDGYVGFSDLLLFGKLFTSNS